MQNHKLSRRHFIQVGGAVIGSTLKSSRAVAPKGAEVGQQAIPKWKGFNLLDYFSPNPRHNYAETTAEDLKWMVDWGFDFIRFPMAYPRYVKFDRTQKINPEEVCRFDSTEIEKIEELVSLAHETGLHVSLNLHRAPGYCVNAGFQEPFNLWKDPEALEAFCNHWGMWAERFKDISPDKISFDLVNEPSMREDMNDQHSGRSAVPGQIYRRVAEAAAKAIRKHNPNHMIIADGNDVGQSVIPEITDLNIAQSCRGYYPHYISHYRAPWVFKNPEEAPEPVWPGEINGKTYGRKDLEQFYQPWIELAQQGVGVHCGECGCWKETPHEVFLSWFGDVIDILGTHGIGFALWNFRGDFGILDSGRRDIEYEDWYGHKLDRKLLDLIRKS